VAEDSSRVVRLVRPRQDDGQGGELPPEFLQLQQVLDSFVAEARQVLEPKDRHLLDLHLGPFVLSDGPPLTFKQLATVLRIPMTGLRLQEEQAIKQLRTRLRLPEHGQILHAVRQAASARTDVLGRPSSRAVLGAFAAAGGSCPLLRLASSVLGGLGTRERWDGSQDLVWA
jgi:hypothetical protein